MFLCIRSDRAPRRAIFSVVNRDHISEPQVQSPRQRESVEFDGAHTTAALRPSPDSRTGGVAASSLSAQTASDSTWTPRTATDSKQHTAGDPQRRWQADQSAQQHVPAATLSSRIAAEAYSERRRQGTNGLQPSLTSSAHRIQQQGSHRGGAQPDDPRPQRAYELSGLPGVSAATGRQLLADAASQPPFTVSPAQSGVRIDSPELRMNGAPTQLFEVDFGKATVELNPINLFSITGAVECALRPGCS